MKRYGKWLMVFMVIILSTGVAYAEPVQGVKEQWAKGVVCSAVTVDVFAPMGGQLLPYDLEVGDVVDAKAALFTVQPVQVFAANSGVVRSLQAVVGDQSAAVLMQYSALCYIDRIDEMVVKATTKAAYNKPENRALILGEKLRVYNGKESDPVETLGTVTAVSGGSYVVEIPSGIFDLEDRVKLYRGTGDSYSSKDKVGEGKVERPMPIPVTAEGVIADVHVSEGQKVARGGVLFTVDTATAIYKEAAKTTVTALQGGVIKAVYAKDGQQVVKDQLLLTMETLDVLEFVVNVDEMNITSIQPGKSMRVKVDSLGGMMIPATVKSINPMGIAVLDTTEYSVILSIQSMPEKLLPGMHVTAYWE